MVIVSIDDLATFRRLAGAGARVRVGEAGVVALVLTFTVVFQWKCSVLKGFGYTGRAGVEYSGSYYMVALLFSTPMVMFSTPLLPALGGLIIYKWIVLMCVVFACVLFLCV